MTDSHSSHIIPKAFSVLQQHSLNIGPLTNKIHDISGRIFLVLPYNSNREIGKPAIDEPFVIMLTSGFTSMVKNFTNGCHQQQ